MLCTYFSFLFFLYSLNVDLHRTVLLPLFSIEPGDRTYVTCAINECIKQMSVAKCVLEGVDTFMRDERFVSSMKRWILYAVNAENMMNDSEMPFRIM